MTTSQILGQAAGWALLNFIWQGILIAVALKIALRFLRSHSAGARYIASCAALVIMLAAPVITFFHLVRDADSFNAKDRLQMAATVANERAGAGRALNDAGQTQLLSQYASRSLQNQENSSTLQWIEDQLNRVAPYLLLAWLAGVVFLSVRFISSWRETRVLKREVEPSLEEWQMMLGQLARRVRVSRPVRLCESALVEVPTVVGWLRPLILFPAQALTGLEPKQLRALLAHELAHIRRYDYLVNMMQALVEILLFYHPAVWWISRQVRFEREHACDDLALDLCNGDAVVYARALLSIEEMRVGVRGRALALAADGGSLIARIRRIVAPRPNRTSPLAAATVSIALLIAVGAVNIVLLQAKAVSHSSMTNIAQAQTGNAYKAMSKDEQTAFIAGKARYIARQMSRTEYEFTPAFEAEIQKSVDYYVRRIGNNLGDRPGKGDAALVFERGQTFAPTLIRIFKARNISPLIGLYLPLIESEYVNLETPNSMGALGMFQFLPQTGERYGLTKQDLTDVEKSADAAARYIADSLGLFHSDPMKEALALLSYNRGRRKVADDLQLVIDDANRRCSICALTAARSRLDKDFQSENVHYVPLFFAAAIIGENPQAFGLNSQPLSSYETPNRDAR